MCKEIKRLTLLSKCTHLSKTDRDAVTWAIQQIEPPTVEPDKGFDGFDFSSWPEIPDQALFTDYVKARKSKHGLIMTQAWIKQAAPHMQTLAQGNVSVRFAIEMAASKGWQGLKSNWVLKEIQEDAEPADEEEITNQNVMKKVRAGNITHISQIPKAIRSDLESAVRFNRIKNQDNLQALYNIGFAL
jgi:hypothetical protein